MGKSYLENTATNAKRKVREKRTENYGNLADQHLETQAREKARGNSLIVFLKRANCVLYSLLISGPLSYTGCC